MSDNFFHPTVKKIGDVYVVTRQRYGWAKEFLDPESLRWQAARPEKDFASEDYAYERLNKVARRVADTSSFNLRVLEDGEYKHLLNISYLELSEWVPGNSKPDVNREYILDLPIGGTTLYKRDRDEYLIERLP